MSAVGLRLGAIGLVAAMLCFAAPAAEAAGCLKGAAVGGAAGHFVGSGHAVAGAAVGCAVGHHEAAKKAAAAKKQTAPQPAPPG